MAATVPQRVDARHVLSSDLHPQMAKAALPEVRKADLHAWRLQIGGAIRIVRGARSLKEFADLVDRDERQIAKWERGEDRPQFDALFAVPALREPLIVALAELAQSDAVTVETQITVRRRA